MLKFAIVIERDIPILTKVAVSAFKEDKIKYGSYPPGIDAESRHMRYMKDADYFKIMKGKDIIGGVIVFNDGAGNYTLGGIFIEPLFQNHGFGKQTICFIEKNFSDAKKWFLDTPYLSFRNHHLYEKMGYIKKGEVRPDEGREFTLFLYEKTVNSRKNISDNQPTLFWDFDGTLAAREGHQRGAMMYALECFYPDHGITIDQLKPHLRNVLPWHMPDVPHLHLDTPALWWAHIEGIFAGAFVKVGIPSDIAKTLAKITHEHYIDADGFVLFPNTIETLASLHSKGWQNVILSNHVPELADIVANKGLGDLFTHVISSANVGYEKPNIEIFKHAIELAGNPDKMVMIGDNINADIHGAINAGMKAILVHTEPDNSVEHFAESIVEVETILDRL